MKRAWKQSRRLAALVFGLVMLAALAVLPAQAAYAAPAADDTEASLMDTIYSIKVPGLSTTVDKELFSDIMQSRGYEITDAENLSGTVGVVSSARATNSTDGTAAMFLQFDSAEDLDLSESTGLNFYNQLAQQIGANNSFDGTSGGASYQMNSSGSVTAFYATEGTSMVFGYIGDSASGATELLSQLGFVEGAPEKIGRVVIVLLVVILIVAVVYFLFTHLAGFFKIRSHNPDAAEDTEGLEKFDPKKAYNPDVPQGQVEQERRSFLQQQGLRPLTSAGPVISKGDEFAPDQSVRQQAQVIADQKWKEEREGHAVNETVGVSVTPQNVANAQAARAADEQAAREAEEQARKEALLDQRRKENIARVKAEQEAKAAADAQKAQAKAAGQAAKPAAKKKAPAQQAPKAQARPVRQAAAGQPARQAQAARPAQPQTRQAQAAQPAPAARRSAAQPTVAQPAQPARKPAARPAAQPAVAPDFASAWNEGGAAGAAGAAGRSASAGWDDDDSSWGNSAARQPRHQATAAQHAPVQQQAPQQPAPRRAAVAPQQQPAPRRAAAPQQPAPQRRPQPAAQPAPAPARPLSPTDSFVNQAALSTEEVETMSELEDAYTPAEEPAPQQAPAPQQSSVFQTNLGQVFVPPALRGKDDPEDLNRPHNFAEETTQVAEAAAAVTATQAGDKPGEAPTEEEIADDQNGYSKRERQRLLDQAKKKSEKKSLFRLKGVYFPGSDE